MLTLVPESLDELITTTQAANHVGVGKAAISNWVSRGHLVAAGLDERGHPLYRLIDVLRAAQQTRRSSIGRNRIA